MTTTEAALLPCPNFIDGEWVEPSVTETAPVHNPSTGEVIAQTPMCGTDEVDAAVRSARTRADTAPGTPLLAAPSHLAPWRGMNLSAVP